jgi:hypothetical protein
MGNVAKMGDLSGSGDAIDREVGSRFFSTE